MTNNPFYEIYRQLSALRKEPEKSQPVINALTQLCREKTKASSLPECLAVADSCLHEISQCQTLFALAISSWLTQAEDIGLAKALEHEASISHFQASTAQAYDLSSIEEPLAILAACRLAALYSSPAVSLGWALSLASSYPSSAAALNVAGQLLQHHIWEFPATTRRLLASPQSPFASLELAAQGLAVLNEQELQQNALPRLRELAMPPEMRLLYSSLRRKENRDIQLRADERSVFHQFVTRQHFKYAHKTAVEFFVGDEVRETTLAMSSYQMSAELPTSALTDPISCDMARNQLWKGLQA